MNTFFNLFVLGSWFLVLGSCFFIGSGIWRLVLEQGARLVLAWVVSLSVGAGRVLVVVKWVWWLVRSVVVVAFVNWDT